MQPDPWDKVYAVLDLGIFSAGLVWRVLKCVIYNLLIGFAWLLAIFFGLVAFWLHPVLTIVIIAILIICL